MFLGLTRLDKRRIRSDLFETVTILNGFYNINKGLFFDIDDGGRRGHKKKLFKRFRLDTRKFVFSNKVVDMSAGMASRGPPTLAKLLNCIFYRDICLRHLARQLQGKTGATIDRNLENVLF